MRGRVAVWTQEKKEELLSAFYKYIEENDIPILAEFCYKHKVNRQRIYEWEEFVEAKDMCLTKKEANLEAMALANEINTTFAIFSLKQLGWRDKQELDLSGTIPIVLDKALEKEIKK